MKKHFTENSFINLNYRERKAVFFLISMVVISILIYCIVLWWPAKQDYSISDFNKIFEDSLSTNPGNDGFGKKEKKPAISLHPFDPNTVTKSELEKFGLLPRVAAIWANYTSKGGRFKSSIDLKKIYGLEPDEIERLRPYILIENEIRSSEYTTILKPLDLNSASYKELIKIGMPGYIASTLLKFKATGKSFNSISDLKKVFGMNDSLVEILAPFIQFNEEIKEDQPVDSVFAKASAPIIKESLEKFKINLNLADTTELKRLPGIGSKLALRITKYRDNLGGFHSPDQLKEIYGLADSVLTKINSKVLAEGGVRKISVNSVDFTKIYHPYIDKKQASVIQSFIRQHQPIQSIEDLKKIEVLDQLFWNNIEPYLEFSIK